MQSFIFITAANAKYFELVKGTLLSIREKSPGRKAVIGFFDLGCTPEQLQWLQTQVDVIRRADWEFDFPGRAEAPEHLKGLLARPFLPRYFPGFEVYFWIDADAWVQDWQAIELFLKGAELRGLAITPEIDRGSRIQYGGLPKYWQWAHHHYQAVFGAEVAQRFQSYPMLNAGVFALHQTAPHWQLWANYLNHGLQRSASLYTDQMALNLTVYAHAFEQTELLPAWCNWTCHYGLPLWDAQRHCLVEPYLPHTPIGILHLTQTKHDRAELLTTEKGRAIVRLQYTSSAQLQQPQTEQPNLVAAPTPKATPQSSSAIAPAMTSTQPSSAMSPAHDYISPGFATVRPDACFPNMGVGDVQRCAWPYLRREIPHHWYVDRRHPFIGFLSRDEAHILYNTALKFQGKRALEIGCWMGWSACHLALAGVRLDVVDPILGKPEFYASVSASLQAAGVAPLVNLVPGYSPQAVEELAAQSAEPWSLIFIDGNHDSPGPLNDAIACEKFAHPDALILFHDLASPEVAEGLDYLQQRGWKTLVYQTMQIMGVAWRGAIEPVQHQPDPSIQWTLPTHLRHHPVSGLSATVTQPSTSSMPGQLLEVFEQVIAESLPLLTQSPATQASQPIASLMQQGQTALIQGELSQAIATFQAVVQVQPQSLLANQALSWLYGQQGQVAASFRHHYLACRSHERQQPADRQEFQELLAVVRPFTMLSEARLYSLYSLAKQICLEDIPGNFVECGTWRGGSAALQAVIIQRYSQRPRRLYACDTFAGMPDPTSVDQHQGTPANNTGFGAGTLKAPRAEGLDVVCQALNVQDLVVPLEGLFAETLPQAQAAIGSIALLHADGDWYESTMDILKTLFDQLVINGCLQIDDYGFWEGCRQAVHEFERLRGLSFSLQRLDDTGVWFRKVSEQQQASSHWRSLYYLAQTAEALGDRAFAERALKLVLQVMPGFLEAEQRLARLQTNNS